MNRITDKELEIINKNIDSLKEEDVKINYVYKKDENIYEICVICEKLNSLKYGGMYLYDYKNKRIKVERENAVYGIKMLIHKGIDLMNIFDETVENYKEETVSEDKMKNLFIGAIN